MQYMGFCGTMGADYIDYIVADNIVIPPQSLFETSEASTATTSSSTTSEDAKPSSFDFYSHYTEKIIAMPHSYFVNDHKQSMQHIIQSSNNDDNSSAMPTRAEVGLPENVFIYCCFNQLHKIDPITFTAWIRILNRVPNSVLWLLRFPACGESNIRKFAAEHGLSDDRLVFTNLANKEDFLKRCTLGNCFLDTPSYNGHTTACDTLWAGFPIVTLCNIYDHQKMCSRVASSLLTACYMPELICDSIAEYENVAVTLGETYSSNLQDKYKCGASLNYHDVRKKLHRNRLTSPAFDTARWVKNFEVALTAAWARYESSQPPDHIQVLDDANSLCDF